jgi:hypothetical protein
LTLEESNRFNHGCTELRSRKRNPGRKKNIMAKSKKELLAGRQKVGRPSLRREVVTNEEQEAAVVRKVSDNPPPPPTASAPAAAATAKPTKKPLSPKPAAKAKKSAPVVKQTDPVKQEPFMRMTFDVPKSLHLKLKMHTLKNGVTIKAHMLRIIEDSIDD